MSLFASLCRSNQGLLKQKLGLMEALIAKHGSQAATIYRQPCPIVQASIGQHIRHSMDHMEKATLALESADAREIHYDWRERGGEDEYDLVAAQARVQRVDAILEELVHSAEYIPVLGHRVEACFMLSGDSETEFMLPSTVAREMGFAAHHAIHHLAMVRIIATGDMVGLSAEDLPPDFGRAPSTVNYDHRVAEEQST